MNRLNWKPLASLAGLTLFCATLLSVKPEPSPSPDQSLTPEQLKTFNYLKASHYFLLASCAGFANAVLDPVGLPRLGQSAPIRGERGNMDRQGERRSPPIFNDSVVRSEKPYLSFDVDGRLSSDFWTLRLSRVSRENSKDDGIRNETTFRFTIDSRLNHPSCELMKIEFQAWSPEASETPRWRKTVGLSDCLSMYNSAASDPVFAGMSAQAAQWLKEDCATGLHFFKEAKDMIADEALKSVNRPKE